MLAAELALLPAYAALAAGVAAPAALSPGLVGAAGLSKVAKVALGVALAGGVAASGARLVEPEPLSKRPAAVVVAPQAAIPGRPKPEAAAAPAAPVLAPAPADGVPQPGPARFSAFATTLAEEGRLLGRAHQLIRSGQGGQALQLLRSSQVRYPRSVLHQEREVLVIEALGATGARSTAQARAQRFLVRYPRSPHKVRLERFVE